MLLVNLLQNNTFSHSKLTMKVFFLHDCTFKNNSMFCFCFVFQLGNFFLSSTIRNVELSNFLSELPITCKKCHNVVHMEKLRKLIFHLISWSKIRLQQSIMIVYTSVNELRNFLSTATPSSSSGFGGDNFGNFPRQTHNFYHASSFAHQDLCYFASGISSTSTSANLQMLFCAIFAPKIKWQILPFDRRP